MFAKRVEEPDVRVDDVGPPGDHEPDGPPPALAVTMHTSSPAGWEVLVVKGRLRGQDNVVCAGVF